ncbi:MAG: primosomal protein N' [Candidatus Omnitrophota bacterium]
MHMDKIAEVAVNLPLKNAYHYRIPHNLKSQLKIGMRVWINFGRRNIIGYVTNIISKTDIANIKPVLSIIDIEPLITAEMIKLSRWISDYYYTSLGEALSLFIPTPLNRGKTKIRTGQSLTPEENISINYSVLKLTPAQSSALLQIEAAVEENKHRVFLLHGITGSGKTEVYIRTIEAVRLHGFATIVLVPEISLTPQTVERFKQRFGSLVAVLHSRMTGSEKFYNWQRIKDGICQIIVGPRSAIFSPVKKLGLVIIDEEHENTYKQEDAPRYHAREVAIKRASLNRAIVILGSATPMLESYYLAKKGKYQLLELPVRVDGKVLPEVQIVNIRGMKYDYSKQNIFSHILQREIRKTLDQKKQIILFLNRRGFSTYIGCTKCGFVLRCERCSITLTYHFDLQQAVCHYCRAKVQPPEMCPECAAAYLKHFGIGTQKVESEIYRLFPDAKIERLDSDATAKRGSHEKIFTDFKLKKTNILIGTQMLAKGFDFPEVALVGVVLADAGFNFPDFRAGEKTFSLLTQVAGRTGRGDEQGKVIVQTCLPTHYAITASAKHDYQQFYQKEIKFRKQLNLPPFSHIIEVTIRGKDEKKIIAEIERLYKMVTEHLRDIKVKISTPAPAPIYKIKKNFYWQILLQLKQPLVITKTLRQIIVEFKKPSGIRLIINVDPR